MKRLSAAAFNVLALLSLLTLLVYAVAVTRQNSEFRREVAQGRFPNSVRWLMIPSLPAERQNCFFIFTTYRCLEFTFNRYFPPISSPTRKIPPAGNSLYDPWDPALPANPAYDLWRSQYERWQWTCANFLLVRIGYFDDPDIGRPSAALYGFRYDLMVPHWLLFALLAALPASSLAVTFRRRARAGRAARQHLCHNCGYDLRATPNRCPECGAVPPPE